VKGLIAKLLSYLPSSIFDKAAYGVPALGVNDPNHHAVWSITGDILSVSSGSDYEYDLSEHTISSLSAALRDDGFVTKLVNSKIALMPATVLVDANFETVAAATSGNEHPKLDKIFDISGLEPGRISSSLSDDKLTLTSSISPGLSSNNRILQMAQTDKVVWPYSGKHGFYFKLTNSGANTITSSYIGLGNIDMDVFDGTAQAGDYFIMPGFVFTQSSGKILLTSLGNPINENAGIDIINPGVEVSVTSATEYCIALNRSAGTYGTLYFYTSEAPSTAIATFPLTSSINPDRLYLGFSASDTNNQSFGVSVGFVETPSVAHTGVTQITAGESFSTGGYFYRHTNILHSFLHAYASELKELALNISRLPSEMVMTTAESEWLDVWGNLFGIKRKVDEVDADMQVRLPAEILRRRVNVLAIEQAILELTGKNVKLEEPWRNMMRFSSNGNLSGLGRTYQGEFAGPHLLQPVSMDGDVEFDYWADVYPIIERNKASGVIVLPVDGDPDIEELIVSLDNFWTYVNVQLPLDMS
jgi:hypothetical protein